MSEFDEFSRTQKFQTRFSERDRDSDIPRYSLKNVKPEKYFLHNIPPAFLLPSNNTLGHTEEFMVQKQVKRVI